MPGSTPGSGSALIGARGVGTTDRGATGCGAGVDHCGAAGVRAWLGVAGGMGGGGGRSMPGVTGIRSGDADGGGIIGVRPGWN